MIPARYATAEAAQRNCPETDLKSLQASLLQKVKERIFDVYDDARLEAVQISILLSSFYLYHARPNLAFSVLGAGIKSAQAMGLHRESSWKLSSVIVRETRRRVWWALYVFDRYDLFSSDEIVLANSYSGDLLRLFLGALARSTI